MTFFLASIENPLTHVVDYPWWQLGKSWPFTFTILSNHVIMMILAAVLLLVFLPRAFRLLITGNEVEQLTPRGLRNFFELICDSLRHYVVQPQLGPYTDRFMPFLWTAFFFIATCNMIGLLPLEPITLPIIKYFHGTHGVFGTATSNIFVTAALACCTFFMIVYNGLKLHGLGYVRHFFMGPFPINILIAFLEMIGVVVKCFALAVRLFANMVAGHILLAIMVGFIGMAGAAHALLGVLVAVPVVLGSVAITLMELFVALLQAYIFTFLSAVFIGLAVNIHPEHPEDGHKV